MWECGWGAEWDSEYVVGAWFWLVVIWWVIIVGVRRRIRGGGDKIQI